MACEYCGTSHLGLDACGPMVAALSHEPEMEAEIARLTAERDAAVAALAQREAGDWSHLRLASAKMREEPEIARRLRTFMDYWGLDAYSPPPDVERNVRDLVHAFLLTLTPIPADPESDNG